VIHRGFTLEHYTPNKVFVSPVGKHLVRVAIPSTQRHMCAFFHSANEEYRVLLPFIKEGFDRGEKAFYTVDPKLREEHLNRLRSAGSDE
jgi:hypothetical protein